METMTKKRKALAVRVAADVLESLKVLTVVHGKYVYSEKISFEGLKGSKEQAQYLKKECDVCALGACLLSLVTLKNKFEFSAQANYDGEKYICMGWQEVADRLSEAFTQEQIQLIEDAFECAQLGTSYPSTEHAIRFGKRYTDNKQRVRAIMKNIIRNGGEFIPPTRQGKKKA